MDFVEPEVYCVAKLAIPIQIIAFVPLLHQSISSPGAVLYFQLLHEVSDNFMEIVITSWNIKGDL